VAEGLAESRTRAQSLILAGSVLVDDVPIDKVGTRISNEARLRLRGGDRQFVSRGGGKLDGALDDLTVDVTGLACLDVGASTGGFTDCLLTRGATSVIAVDVGRGQLHERLRQDPRVTLLERTNARYLTTDQLPAKAELVVVDVSFISLRLLLGPLFTAVPGVPVLVLVKPQFEVGKERVGKGGVVRDDVLREEAVQGIAACGEEQGYRVAGRAESRVEGPKGNREVFLLFEPGGTGEPAGAPGT
jgi:23S rRNA (cytidine1920-2'-O)/16S rRNA (cytidine1409-2'-O)-methyltransferase